jgi:hypothetical protein
MAGTKWQLSFLGKESGDGFRDKMRVKSLELLTRMGGKKSALRF